MRGEVTADALLGSWSVGSLCQVPVRRASARSTRLEKGGEDSDSWDEAVYE